MARITRAQMRREADYFADVAAPRSNAAAADGERVAADPTRSDYTRACAARAAEIARRHAADYLSIAETLRAGEIPEGVDFS
ncbi:hypothetical protein ACLQ18_39545 [Streptomyces sp. DT193]|uniref:hypothetical protein n=1 Tax=Streptomyces sp. DT193 TaxID=3393418 RepID=UPI003CF9368D